MNSEHLTIRHATLADLDSITKLEAISYPQAEAASRESIEKRLKHFSDYFWLLEKENELVGFINGYVTDEEDLTDDMYEHAELHNPEGIWMMIFSVVTAPQYRGLGYASFLMEQVISDIKQQGKSGLVLTCKEGLLPFYSRFGYQNEGVSGSTHGAALWYQMRLRFC